MSKRPRSALVLGAVVLAIGSAAAAITYGGEAEASPAQNPLLEIRQNTRVIRAAVTNRTFGLREIKREIRQIEARSNRLGVMAEVNEAACAAGAVQCGNGATGHTFTAASSTNHNPVAIVVLVALNGVPVTGLAASAFDFSDGIVPAGGPGVALCPAGGTGCASPGDLFQDAGNGMYVLWAHPAPAGNWKAGSYYARITVTAPAGVRGSALVEITVP